MLRQQFHQVYRILPDLLSYLEILSTRCESLNPSIYIRCIIVRIWISRIVIVCKGMHPCLLIMFNKKDFRTSHSRTKNQGLCSWQKIRAKTAFNSHGDTDRLGYDLCFGFISSVLNSIACHRLGEHGKISAGNSHKVVIVSLSLFP